MRGRSDGGDGSAGADATGKVKAALQSQATVRQWERVGVGERGAER